MKYVDEFRNPHKAKALLREIEKLIARIDICRHRPLSLMEVCGGHTHTIFKFGVETMLPDAIELVHGPGCPVCVLPMGRVDDCVALAETPGVIFTTFGDAIRVPGSKKSLLQAKAGGADVRMVYSPLDALKLARLHPEKEIVFFGLGFETTMPSTALTILQAEREGIHNFSLFCNHITIIPTIKAILDSPELQIDGFLGPGHVSMVIGTRPYRFIAEHYKRPLVIAGFEPLDVLQSVWMLLKQIAEGRCEIENQSRPDAHLQRHRGIRDHVGRHQPRVCGRGLCQERYVPQGGGAWHVGRGADLHGAWNPIARSGDDLRRSVAAFPSACRPRRHNHRDGEGDE
jgi:hydrogenase expression/formation protein HypD